MYHTTTTGTTLHLNKPAARQGWQCPLCLLVYSPDVESCDCDQNDFVSTDWGKIPLDDPYTWYPLGNGTITVTNGCAPNCTMCNKDNG